MGNMVCHVCGKGYDPGDVETYAATKDVQLSVLDMDNPGMRKLLGMKTLMRCSNCGKVCCADCAKKGTGSLSENKPCKRRQIKGKVQRDCQR